MSWVAVATGGISLLGTGMSLIGSKKANKEIQNQINEANKSLYNDKAKLEEWRLKNQSMPKLAEMLGLLNAESQDANQTVAGNTAMTGASNANITAQKKASQDTLMRAILGINQQNSNYQQAVDNQWLSSSDRISDRKLGLQNAQIGLEQSKAQQWANFMQSLDSAGSGLLLAGLMNPSTGGKTNDLWAQLLSKGIDPMSVKFND